MWSNGKFGIVRKRNSPKLPSFVYCAKSEKKHILLIQSNLQSSTYLALLLLKYILKTKWWSGKVCFVISKTKPIDKMLSGPIFIDLPSGSMLRCHLKLSRSCWSGFSTRGFATPSACWRDRPRSEEEAGRRGGYIGTAAGVDTLASNNRPPHSIQLRRCLTRHFDEVVNRSDIKEGEKGWQNQE